MQKTPLYYLHVKLHGKMHDYFGYALPSSYEAGAEKEREKAKNDCGLFDASFLGELELAGEKPAETLEKVFGAKFSELAVGHIQNATLFGENVDVYHVAKNVFMIVVAPSVHEKTVKFIRENLVGKTTLLDISNALGAVLVKGAKAKEILSSVMKVPENVNSFSTVVVKDASCIVADTKAGFLIACNFQKIKAVYEEIALVGIPKGMIPCGTDAMN